MPEVKLADGGTLHYEEHGDGEPVLILNGLMMATRSWVDHLPMLAPHVRVILVDFRDQGRSSRLEAGYDLSQHAADLETAGLLVRCHHQPAKKGDDQVLIAVVIEIDQQCAAGTLQPVDAPRIRDAGHRSVCLLQEKPVWQTRLLAHEQVLQAIAVDIPQGEPRVAQGSEISRVLDPIQPVVQAHEKLSAIRSIGLQNRLPAVGK